MNLSMDEIWQQYGMDQLKEGLDTLFPGGQISFEEIWNTVLQGDIPGAILKLFKGMFGEIGSQLGGLKNILIWLLVMGIVSALLSHFAEIFDRHQVADLSFYFMYLLLTAVLLIWFGKAAAISEDAMEGIVDFIRLLIPTYLLMVGAAAGTVTVSASYHLMLLLIYGVEKLLIGAIIPLTYSYVMLAVVNGIWSEEKLGLLMDLLERAIKAVLKGCLGVVTGVSVFQAVITPAVDSVKTSALQKAISAIPGIGGAADGIVELVMGSALIIKNSVGVVLLLLLLAACAAPLLYLFVSACLMKAAAAFMGIISDKRITACTDKTGEGSMLLFKTTGTALLLFVIALSMIAASTKR